MDDFPAKNDVEAVRERISSVLRDLLGTRQKQLRAQDLTGYKAGTLKDWGSGRTTPRTEDFLVLAAALGVDPAVALGLATEHNSPEPVDQAAQDRDFVGVPLLDVRIAAGAGGINADKVAALDTLQFPKWFIQRLGGRAETVQLFRPSGDSMSPTIEDGALVMFDHAQKTLPKLETGRAKPPPDAVWVFRYDGAMFVKRLRRLPKGYLAMISDNAQDHPISIIDPGDTGKVKIVGKAIWWDNRL